jgi:hypothetical protein
MKNPKSILFLLLLSSSLFFTSCSETQDDVNTTGEIVSQGKWSVDYYFMGQDRTAQYSNYQFVFSGNGNLTGTHGTISFTGAWNIIKDINNEDLLQINIATQEPQLNDLNDRWNVTNTTTAVVAMKSASGTNAQFRIRKL